MKIVVTSTGETPESPVDSRFGRAAKFILGDLLDEGTVPIPNPQVDAALGDGCGVVAGTTKEAKPMRIAIPLADGKLSMHFGHCERFVLIDLDPTSGKMIDREDIEPPPHEPGLLPLWLAERGAEVIIAGGMGRRARELFAEHGIRVVVAAPPETAERLADEYLAGTLQAGENVCDH